LLQPISVAACSYRVQVFSIPEFFNVARLALVSSYSYRNCVRFSNPTGSSPGFAGEAVEV
jgi:hypothetical protein